MGNCCTSSQDRRFQSTSTTKTWDSKSSKSLRTSIDGNWDTTVGYRTTESTILDVIEIINNKNSNGLKIDRSCFEIIKKLGRGAYAEVYLVKYKENEQLYAMKCIKKDSVIHHMQKTRIFEEKNILTLTNSPFIVNLYFCFQDDNFLYFILDYMEWGDLLDLINKFSEEDQLSEDIARFISAEVLWALDSLHRKKIIYRDLKPQNILVDRDGHIKLTDFGLSKSRFNPKQENTLWGTIKYMAPEILHLQKYNYTVDFWSLGILIFRIITGVLPYSDTKSSQIKDIIKFEEIDTNVEFFEDDTKDLLWKLLTKDPSKRLGANGIEEIK